MTSAAAGWYPDSIDPRITRYWNGVSWSAERVWDGTAWIDRGQPATDVWAPAGPATGMRATALPATDVWTPALPRTDMWAPDPPATALPATALPATALPPAADGAPAERSSPGYGSNGYASPGYSSAPGYASAGYASAGYTPSGYTPAGHHHQPAQAAGVTSRTPVGTALRNRMVLLIGGAVLIIIACLLPWASQNYIVTTRTISGTSAGGGQLSIVLALVIGAMAGLVLAGIVGAKKAAITTLSLGALALVVCIANMANVSSVMDGEAAAGAADTGAGTSFGIGLFVLLVADIIVVVASMLTLFSRRRAQL